MRSVVILFFVSTIIAKTASAQLFTFGPKLGANFSYVNFDKTFSLNAENYQMVTKSAKLGAAAGLFFRFKSKKGFMVQPEAIFSQERSSFELRKLSADNITEIKNIRVDKVDFPINIGFKLGKVFRIYAAPIGSYVLASKIESTSDLVDYVSNVNYTSLQWSGQVGIGLDIKKRTTLDLSYQTSIAKPTNDLMVNNVPITFSTGKKVVQFTLGVAFIKFKNKKAIKKP